MAVALVSPRLVPPLASALGRPGRRIAGSAGALARENAMRNPGRTAATAAALMIGIALVTFVAVIGQGMRDSTKGSLEQSLRGDYVLGGQDGWSPIDPAAVRAAAKVPGVELATGIVEDTAKSFGERATVDGVDPAAISRVYGWPWQDGSDESLARLDDGGAIVTDRYAEDHGIKVGDTLAVTAPRGDKLSLEVAGISEPDRFNPLALGDITIARAAFDRSFTAERERYGFVKADASAEPALKQALAGYPDVKLQTSAEFVDLQSAWVDQILAIFYVLLALCVLVSLFGIVNTLALSVLERTRELGMLKAIGMTRRQVRRMVRHESIVTAMIGVGAGHRRRPVPRRARHDGAERRGAAVRPADRLADRVLPALGDRRDAGGDPARPAGLADRRAERAAVRVDRELRAAGVASTRPGRSRDALRAP